MSLVMTGLIATCVQPACLLWKWVKEEADKASNFIVTIKRLRHFPQLLYSFLKK